MLTGSAVVFYDGNPTYPDVDVLWRMSERTGATFFGTSPAYVSLMMQHGVVPKDRYDLSALEGIFCVGSPASPEHFLWFYENVKADLWLTSQSGGTDIASSFVGGCPLLPVYAGEIQTRFLGADVHAYDDDGNAVIDQLGELVVRQPLPSMPLYLWDDAGNKRYMESYFDMYPGIWRHGDYLMINARGGCYIRGRSDSTLNRHGVRIGTSEIYRTLEAIDEITDSLIVNLDLPGGAFFMPLFVMLADGCSLNAALEDRFRATLRAYSPRHVPDRIYAVDAIPYTLTGKKMEVPVRKILMGVPADQAATRDAMAAPEALDYFVHFAHEHENYGLG
jgi:acetoacetyl-CoA synthetase